MMTGIFLTILRDGVWQSMDITELTDEELDAWAELLTLEELRQWSVTLVRMIRDDVTDMTDEAI